MWKEAEGPSHPRVASDQLKGRGAAGRKGNSNKLKEMAGSDLCFASKIYEDTPGIEGLPTQSQP